MRPTGPDSPLYIQNQKPPGMVYGGVVLSCALLIIGGIGLGLGCVGVAGFGAHRLWWSAGALSQLGQFGSIGMMTAGGVGSILLTIGIIGAVKSYITLLKMRHAKNLSIQKNTLNQKHNTDVEKIKKHLMSEGKQEKEQLQKKHNEKVKELEKKIEELKEEHSTKLENQQKEFEQQLSTKLNEEKQDLQKKHSLELQEQKKQYETEIQNLITQLKEAEEKLKRNEGKEEVKEDTGKKKSKFK